MVGGDKTGQDLVAKDWYNGPITRQAAVGLLEAEGDFMLRDCISIPGDYVLTCMTKDDKVLHFKLNKVLVGGEYHYQFEGNLFPTVVELIEHHVESGEPISNSSNAFIRKAKTHRQSSLEHSRSQSSMSGDTNSTISSGGSAPLTKSGSRASLLKDSNNESQLKRFKSLPAGKIRRTKRKAPSPPKDKKPLLRNETGDSTDAKPEDQRPQTVVASHPASSYSKPIQTLGEKLKLKKPHPLSLLEGVKLRRKKFSQMLPKPLNLRQRQSMHITAELQDHLAKSLTEDHRRYSMPRLLDDSEEEDLDFIHPTSRLQSSKLVRSPSDTSIIYLHQLTARNPFIASNNKCSHRTCLVPALPVKKRPLNSRPNKDGLQVLNHHKPPAVKSPPNEAIYDCLPKPRSMLTDQQIQYNQIYDIPRNLLIPKETSKVSLLESALAGYESRSISAFSSHPNKLNRRQPHPRQSSECVSVCSFNAASMDNGHKLNRHGNFEDGLDQERDLDKPALPPKGRRKFQEDIYNVPRKLDDGISLCSDFSYCSDCTDYPGEDEEEEPSTMTRFSEDVTPFRFSPTSFLSETSMSFQDYEDEHGKIGDMAKGASSCLKVASSVSSVSSVTLQGEDTLSLGYDTTSLPEDPFPEGLPSSASSTIGTSASSRYGLIFYKDMCGCLWIKSKILSEI